MKNVCRLMCLMMVAILLGCMMTSSASAAVSYSKTSVNAIRDKWNATTWSKSNAVNNTYKYEGAYQCAAFSRYVFMQLYGHADTLNNKNNKVTIKNFTTESAMLDFLKTTAAPGDALRITNLKNGHTHILHLFDMDKAGKVTVYESNYTGAATGKGNNKARLYTYGSLGAMINHATGAKVPGGKFNATIELKVIHSVKNGNKPGSLSANKSACTSHSYKGGICTKCKAEYKLTISSMTATAFKVTKSGSAPVWSRPYSNNSVQKMTMKKGSIVVAVAKTVNEDGNLWYKLTTGDWIFSGNVKKTGMPANARYIANTSDGLNMRAGAGTAFKVLQLIPTGAMVTAKPLSKIGSWTQVTYNGVTGYVSTKYLSTAVPK